MLRVLYVINTGLLGGLQAHVKCLMESLAGVAETAVVINTEIDPKVVSMFEEAGTQGLSAEVLRDQYADSCRKY